MSKILVIDDEEDLRDLISLYLRVAGHEAVTAQDGEEGLRKFDESLFDAVITDITMPKCNGDEVARYIRNSAKRIPIVAITGTPWDVDHGIFDRVMDKPFLYEEFIECVESVMLKDRSD